MERVRVSKSWSTEAECRAGAVRCEGRYSAGCRSLRRRANDLTKHARNQQWPADATRTRRSLVRLARLHARLLICMRLRRGGRCSALSSSADWRTGERAFAGGWDMGVVLYLVSGSIN